MLHMRVCRLAIFLVFLKERETKTYLDGKICPPPAFKILVVHSQGQTKIQPVCQPFFPLNFDNSPMVICPVLNSVKYPWFSGTPQEN